MQMKTLIVEERSSGVNKICDALLLDRASATRECRGKYYNAAKYEEEGYSLHSFINQKYLAGCMEWNIQ